MQWRVEFTAKAAKQKRDLPLRMAERLDAMRKAIEFAGPTQPSMPHFGKLKNRAGDVYHCHLNKGRPVYVVVWQVRNRSVRIVEMTYVGTHEKAQ